MRHHVSSTAVVLVLMLLALAAVMWSANRDEAPPQPPAAVDPVELDQRTALIQVRDDRSSVVSALVGVGGTDPGSVYVSVPRETTLVTGAGAESLFSVSLGTDERAPARGLATTLGVRVDLDWQLDRKALAGWVDAAGGVRADVEEVLRFRAADGSVVLTLQPGAHRLTGPDASWYVTGWVRGENTSRPAQARFRAVLEQLLEVLPRDPAAVRQLLISLGALSSPSTTNEALADLLVDLAADVRAQRVTGYALPLVRPVPPGILDSLQPLTPDSPTNPQVGPGLVDQARTTPVLRRLFDGSPRVPGDDDPARVLLWNRSGDPWSVAAAMLQLDEAGLVGVPAEAADGGAVAAVSGIDGRGYDDAGTAWSAVAAAALELTDAVLRGDVGTISAPPTEPAVEDQRMPAPTARPWGDVDVILGGDYFGCLQTGVCPADADSEEP